MLDRIIQAFSRPADSSDRTVRIAQRAIKNPASISLDEIKSLAGSVIRQAKR